jgi:mannosyltransferase
MQMSFADMLDTVPESEATPPLFYVAEWVAAQLFGTGEVGLRLLPALLGVLTIPAVYALGLLAVSRRAGLAAAALVSVNPFLVWYSQEARAYSPMILLVALSLACLAAHARDGRGHALAGWAGASALAIATHYFALIVVVPAAAWLLLGARGERALLRRRAAAVAVPAVVGLALVPLALHQREAVGDPGGIGDRGLPERLVSIPKSFLLGYSLPAEALLVVLAALCALVALASAALAAPFGFDYASSKNVIAALVPAAIVLGCGFAASRYGRVAFAGIAVVSVVTVVGVAAEPEHQRPDWRGAARAVGPVGPERVLVFNPSFRNTGPFSVYFGPGEIPDEPHVRPREVYVVALAQVTGAGLGAPEPPDDPAARPPRGFRLVGDRLTESYRIVRYAAPSPVTLSWRDLALIAFPEARSVFVRQPPSG